MAMKKTWDLWLAVMTVALFWVPIIFLLVYYVVWVFLINFILIKNWQFVLMFIAISILLSVLYAAHARVGREIDRRLAEENDDDVA